MIKIDHKTHVYTDEKSQVYKAVSKILDYFENPFDPNGDIAAAVAKREGKTKAQVQAEWKANGIESMRKGTSLHNSLQNWIEKEEINDYWLEEITNFRKLKFEGEMLCERIVANKKFKIAGTADCLNKNKYGLNIWDFKTGKEMSFYTKYKTKLLHPLEHLDQCKYTRYSLQLSLYAWMLEQEGENISRLGIIWFKPDHKIKVIPVIYMKYEIEKMLSALPKEFFKN